MNNSTIKQFNNNGFLLVFEGIDGSGKTTQIDLLTAYLIGKNIPYEVISFPQYGQNKYADKIYEYLSGKFGKLSEIDPYSIAKLYASDRKTVKKDLKKWLEAGKLVIVNRYISSSKAHLGANLPDDKREEFIRWIDQMEYKENEMPKEDLIILLDVNSKVGQENVLRKHEGDLHEKNLKHLEEANKIYLQLARSNPKWYVIDCMDNGKMRSKEEIHTEILEILARYIA